MKVKDILKAIEELDSETEVSFVMEDGCCGDTRDLTPIEEEPMVTTVESKVWGNAVFVEVRFASLPGYHSCLQVGETIKANDEYWTRFGKPERVVKK